MTRKRNTAAARHTGPIQRHLDRERADRAAEPLVPIHAQRHGDYGQTTISVTAGEFPDEPAHKQKRVTMNNGGSAIQRWIASESLTRPQIDAINLYSRAWHRVFSEPRVTANLSPMAFIRSTGNDELANATKIDAMELLKLLDERIFDIAPPYYRDVWQNVVIFDSSAHEAGGGSRASAERAKTICLFIADIIATVMRL